MRFSPGLLRSHALLFLTGILAGFYGWAMLAATLSGHDGAIGLGFNALGADWIIAEKAAHAVMAHQAAHIYDQSWITKAVNHDYAGWLSQPLPYPIFPYPPVSLLLVTPFSFLPMPFSVLAFELVSFAALALALARLSQDRATWIYFVLGAAISPSAAMNIAAGQNGFLIASLLIGGITLLDTKPGIAGVVLGLLLFKPQFLPLAAVALIASGSWRALRAMVGTVLILCLLSVLLFGMDLWWLWADSFLHPGQGTGINGNAWGHMWDSTVSTCLSLLGAPAWAATAGQALAALTSVILVWRAFRADFTSTGRLGALICATLLASPHLSSYDMVALAVAALIAVADLPPRTRPMALMLPLMAYAAPIYDPPRYNSLGLITPLVLLALAIWFVTRKSLLAAFNRDRPLPEAGVRA